MNASAYLTRHGWLGNGQPLHPNGKGIKKPLTITKKTNNYGVGKKKVDVHADLWWDRAFDSTLKELNLRVSGSSSNLAKENTPSRDAPKAERARPAVGSPLSGFVKGEALRGTIPSLSSRAEVLAPVGQDLGQGIKQGNGLVLRSDGSVNHDPTTSKDKVSFQSKKPMVSRNHAGAQETYLSVGDAKSIDRKRMRVEVKEPDSRAVDFLDSQVNKRLLQSRSSAVVKTEAELEQAHSNADRIAFSNHGLTANNAVGRTRRKERKRAKRNEKTKEENLGFSRL